MVRQRLRIKKMVGCLSLLASMPLYGDSPGKKIIFNASPGYYDELRDEIFEVKDKLCVSLNILEAYEHEEWLPVIGIHYKNAEESASVQYIADSPGSSNYSLYSFVGPRELKSKEDSRETRLFFSGLEQGKKIQVEYTGDSLKVSVDGEAREVAIGFVPEYVTYSASTAKAEIRFLDCDKCN